MEWKTLTRKEVERTLRRLEVSFIQPNRALMSCRVTGAKGYLLACHSNMAAYISRLWLQMECMLSALVFLVVCLLTMLQVWLAALAAMFVLCNLKCNCLLWPFLFAACFSVGPPLDIGGSLLVCPSLSSWYCAMLYR